MFQIYMVGVLNDSNVIRTNIQTKRKHDSLVLNSWSFTIMASVAGTKRKAENKSCKLKYKALKELEKGTTLKDVAAQFGVPISTLSTWKKNKEKIIEQYNGGQLSKRVKPEKYEHVNKSVYKWLLMLRSENIPISGPMLKEKALEFAKELGIESFQASEGWLSRWKDRYVYFLFLFCLT